MTYDEFQQKHSELIMCFQCIEHDIKLVYAGMKEGDFDENLDILNKSNLGNTINRLRELDNSDGKPDLSNEDYNLLDQIRKIRNYWCHQCYVDFVYISNNSQQDEKMLKIFRRLDNDYNRIYKLHRKIEQFRLKNLKKYNRI